MLYEVITFLQHMNGERAVRDCIPESEDLAPLLQTLRALDMVHVGPRPLAPATAGEMPIRVLFDELEAEAVIDAEEPVSFDDLVGDADLDLDLSYNFV